MPVDATGWRSIIKPCHLDSYTLRSPEVRSRGELAYSRIRSRTIRQNSPVCQAARPTNRSGDSAASKSTRANAGSFRSRSIRSFGRPCCFTCSAAASECRGCARAGPAGRRRARTPAIRISSVAMNGSSARPRPRSTSDRRPARARRSRRSAGSRRSRGTARECSAACWMNRPASARTTARPRSERVLHEADDEPRQPGRALAAHRVALVRHRAGADLLLLERLLDLLQPREEADVVAELVHARRDARQR